MTNTSSLRQRIAPWPGPVKLIAVSGALLLLAAAAVIVYPWAVSSGWPIVVPAVQIASIAALVTGATGLVVALFWAAFRSPML